MKNKQFKTDQLSTQTFSVMTVCVNGFRNDVMTCMLQIDYSWRG